MANITFKHPIDRAYKQTFPRATSTMDIKLEEDKAEDMVDAYVTIPQGVDGIEKPLKGHSRSNSVHSAITYAILNAIDGE